MAAQVSTKMLATMTLRFFQSFFMMVSS